MILFPLLSGSKREAKKKSKAELGTVFGQEKTDGLTGTAQSDTFEIRLVEICPVSLKQDDSTSTSADVVRGLGVLDCISVIPW